MDNAVEVRRILQIILEKKHDHTAFADDDSLVVSGRLASVDVLDLVLMLEDRFGVDFSARPFDQYEFDTVKSVLRLVEEPAS